MTYEPAQTIDQLTTMPSGLPGLKVVHQHCHFMHQATRPEQQPAMSKGTCEAILSNVVLFGGGREFAHQATVMMPDYAPVEIDASLDRLQRQSAIIGCQRVRELGFIGCPTNGCTLPSGAIAQSPSDLSEWSEIGWNGIPDPIILNAYRERFFPGGLCYAHEAYQGYQQGAFEKIEEQSGIQRRMITHLGRFATASRVASLTKLLQGSVAEVHEMAPPNIEYLCLGNGTLNLATQELEAHNPSHRLQHRFNHHWNPTATCPRFEAFLAASFAPDADRHAKIALLQEWIGYLLVPDTSLQKMVWLVGGGGNGKSVLLDVIGSLLGGKYISAAMLDRLDRSYVRAELSGKLVNISSEIAAEAVIKDGFMKAIVAGEAIEAAYKRKPSFSFVPTARLMAATNNLPQLKDTTDGFNRRLIIVPFNRKFTVAEQNPRLREELVAELPGILVWAVAGLRRLRERGYFAIPPSSEQALELFKAEANPVKQFTDECLVASPNNRGIPSSDLFRVFVSWCAERKLECGNINRFGRALTNLGFQKRKSGREFWLLTPNANYGPYFSQRGVTLASASMPISVSAYPVAPTIISQTMQ